MVIGILGELNNRRDLVSAVIARDRKTSPQLDFSKPIDYQEVERTAQ